MAQKVIHWGILGPGKIAHPFCQDLQRVEGARLLAIGSRDKQRAQGFADEYGAAKYYGSYQELAEDPEVDVVYIATPHVFHFENAMLCLENGKHVVCEKPFGINRKEVAVMIEKARSEKRFVMEAMWTRFLPATEKVMELLKQKVIGDPLHFSADFGFTSGPEPKARLFQRALGGGSLMDIGIYPVYLSLLFFGLPRSVQAIATLNQDKVDKSFAALFGYADDKTATLESTLVSKTRNEAVIYGSEGSITMHARMHECQKISVHMNNGTTEIFDVPYTGRGYYHEIVGAMQSMRQGHIENDKMPHQMSKDLIQTLDIIKQKIGVRYPSDE